MSSLATRMTDVACFSFVQLCLQIRASSLFSLWPRSLSSSDDLSWSVITLSLNTCTVGYTLSAKWLSRFALAAGEARECYMSLRLLSGLLERWQGLLAIQQVSGMLFPTVELSTPGIGASFSPLSMQVANTSSSSRTYSCKSTGSMVALPSLSSSSVSTTPSKVSHCCGRSRLILWSLCRKCGSGMSPAMMRTRISWDTFSLV